MKPADRFDPAATKPPAHTPRSRPLMAACRIFIAVLFIAAGVNHFVVPAIYKSIVPPTFPRPELLVIISGLAEIAGGVGLLVPRLRRLAAWGLIAFLIAVFPANLYMALNPDRPPQSRLPEWSLWLRLPLQFVLLWVVALIGLGGGTAKPSDSPPVSR